MWGFFQTRLMPEFLKLTKKYREANPDPVERLSDPVDQINCIIKEFELAQSLENYSQGDLKFQQCISKLKRCVTTTIAKNLTTPEFVQKLKTVLYRLHQSYYTTWSLDVDNEKRNYIYTINKDYESLLVLYVRLEAFYNIKNEHVTETELRESIMQFLQRILHDCYSKDNTLSNLILERDKHLLIFVGRALTSHDEACNVLVENLIELLCKRLELNIEKVEENSFPKLRNFLAKYSPDVGERTCSLTRSLDGREDIANTGDFLQYFRVRTLKSEPADFFNDDDADSPSMETITIEPKVDFQTQPPFNAGTTPASVVNQATTEELTCMSLLDGPQLNISTTHNNSIENNNFAKFLPLSSDTKQTDNTPLVASKNSRTNSESGNQKHSLVDTILISDSEDEDSSNVLGNVHHVQAMIKVEINGDERFSCENIAPHQTENTTVDGNVCVEENGKENPCVNVEKIAQDLVVQTKDIMGTVVNSEENLSHPEVNKEDPILKQNVELNEEVLLENAEEVDIVPNIVDQAEDVIVDAGENSQEDLSVADVRKILPHTIEQTADAILDMKINKVISHTAKVERNAKDVVDEEHPVLERNMEENGDRETSHENIAEVEEIVKVMVDQEHPVVEKNINENDDVEISHTIAPEVEEIAEDARDQENLIVERNIDEDDDGDISHEKTTEDEDIAKVVIDPEHPIVEINMDENGDGEISHKMTAEVGENAEVFVDQVHPIVEKNVYENGDGEVSHTNTPEVEQIAEDVIDTIVDTNMNQNGDGEVSQENIADVEEIAEIFVDQEHTIVDRNMGENSDVEILQQEDTAEVDEIAKVLMDEETSHSNVEEVAIFPELSDQTECHENVAVNKKEAIPPANTEEVEKMAPDLVGQTEDVEKRVEGKQKNISRDKAEELEKISLDMVRHASETIEEKSIDLEEKVDRDDFSVAKPEEIEETIPDVLGQTGDAIVDTNVTAIENIPRGNTEEAEKMVPANIEQTEDAIAERVDDQDLLCDKKMRGITNADVEKNGNEILLEGEMGRVENNGEMQQESINYVSLEEKTDNHQTCADFLSNFQPTEEPPTENLVVECHEMIVDDDLHESENVSDHSLLLPQEIEHEVTIEFGEQLLDNHTVVDEFGTISYISSHEDNSESEGSTMRDIKGEIADKRQSDYNVNDIINEWTDSPSSEETVENSSDEIVGTPTSQVTRIPIEESVTECVISADESAHIKHTVEEEAPGGVCQYNLTEQHVPSPASEYYVAAGHVAVANAEMFNVLDLSKPSTVANEIVIDSNEGFHSNNFNAAQDNSRLNLLADEALKSANEAAVKLEPESPPRKPVTRSTSRNLTVKMLNEDATLCQLVREHTDIHTEQLRSGDDSPHERTIDTKMETSLFGYDTENDDLILINTSEESNHKPKSVDVKAEQPYAILEKIHQFLEENSECEITIPVVKHHEGTISKNSELFNIENILSTPSKMSSHNSMANKHDEDNNLDKSDLPTKKVENVDGPLEQNTETIEVSNSEQETWAKKLETKASVKYYDDTEMIISHVDETIAKICDKLVQTATSSKSTASNDQFSDKNISPDTSTETIETNDSFESVDLTVEKEINDTSTEVTQTEEQLIKAKEIENHAKSVSPKTAVLDNLIEKLIAKAKTDETKQDCDRGGSCKSEQKMKSHEKLKEDLSEKKAKISDIKKESDRSRSCKSSSSQKHHSGKEREREESKKKKHGKTRSVDKQSSELDETKKENDHSRSSSKCSSSSKTNDCSDNEKEKSSHRRSQHSRPSSNTNDNKRDKHSNSELEKKRERGSKSPRSKDHKQSKDRSKSRDKTIINTDIEASDNNKEHKGSVKPAVDDTNKKSKSKHPPSKAHNEKTEGDISRVHKKDDSKKDEGSRSRPNEKAKTLDKSLKTSDVSVGVKGGLKHTRKDSSSLLPKKRPSADSVELPNKKLKTSAETVTNKTETNKKGVEVALKTQSAESSVLPKKRRITTEKYSEQLFDASETVKNVREAPYVTRTSARVEDSRSKKGYSDSECERKRESHKSKSKIISKNDDKKRHSTSPPYVKHRSERSKSKSVSTDYKIQESESSKIRDLDGENNKSKHKEKNISKEAGNLHKIKDHSRESLDKTKKEHHHNNGDETSADNSHSRAQETTKVDMQQHKEKENKTFNDFRNLTPKKRRRTTQSDEAEPAKKSKTVSENADNSEKAASKKSPPLERSKSAHTEKRSEIEKQAECIEPPIKVQDSKGMPYLTKVSETPEVTNKILEEPPKLLKEVPEFLDAPNAALVPFIAPENNSSSNQNPPIDNQIARVRSDIAGLDLDIDIPNETAGAGMDVPVATYVVQTMDAVSRTVIAIKVNNPSFRHDQNKANPLIGGPVDDATDDLKVYQIHPSIGTSSVSGGLIDADENVQEQDDETNVFNLNLSRRENLDPPFDAGATQIYPSNDLNSMNEEMSSEDDDDDGFDLAHNPGPSHRAKRENLDPINEPPIGSGATPINSSNYLRTLNADNTEVDDLNILPGRENLDPLPEPTLTVNTAQIQSLDLDRTNESNTERGNVRNNLGLVNEPTTSIDSGATHINSSNYLNSLNANITEEYDLNILPRSENLDPVTEPTLDVNTAGIQSLALDRTNESNIERGNDRNNLDIVNKPATSIDSGATHINSSNYLNSLNANIPEEYDLNILPRSENLDPVTDVNTTSANLALATSQVDTYPSSHLNSSVRSESNPKIGVDLNILMNNLNASTSENNEEYNSPSDTQTVNDLHIPTGTVKLPPITDLNSQIEMMVNDLVQLSNKDKGNRAHGHDENTANAENTITENTKAAETIINTSTLNIPAAAGPVISDHKHVISDNSKAVVAEHQERKSVARTPSVQASANVSGNHGTVGFTNPIGGCSSDKPNKQQQQKVVAEQINQGLIVSSDQLSANNSCITNDLAFRRKNTRTRVQTTGNKRVNNNQQSKVEVDKRPVQTPLKKQVNNSQQSKVEADKRPVQTSAKKQVNNSQQSKVEADKRPGQLSPKKPTSSNLQSNVGKSISEFLFDQWIESSKLAAKGKPAASSSTASFNAAPVKSYSTNDLDSTKGHGSNNTNASKLLLKKEHEKAKRRNQTRIGHGINNAGNLRYPDVASQQQRNNIVGDSSDNSKRTRAGKSGRGNSNQGNSFNTRSQSMQKGYYTSQGQEAKFEQNHSQDPKRKLRHHQPPGHFPKQGQNGTRDQPQTIQELDGEETYIYSGPPVNWTFR